MKTGDIVRVKGQSANLCVWEVDEKYVRCIWFNNFTTQQQDFHKDCLCVVAGDILSVEDTHHTLIFLHGELYSQSTYNALLPKLRELFTEVEGENIHGERCYKCIKTFSYILQAIF